MDFVNPGRSIHYNPLSYIKNEQDVIKLSYVLGSVTEDGSPKHYDPFWTQTSRLLFSALIAYVKEALISEEQNLGTVFEMINMINNYTPSMDEKGMELDYLFKKMGESPCQNDMRKFAVSQYRKFRVSAEKTLRSIVISTIAGVAGLDTSQMRELMAYDETDICMIGERKTAFFIVVSDTDRSMDVLANIFFTQALNELCTYADTKCRNNRLPVDVRFIMDDFATNCRVDNFPRMIASFRSRGISTMLMLQAESQLKASYGEDGQTIIGSCDSYVYLGGNDLETARAISEKSDYPIQDVLNMPVGESIILRRGENPTRTKWVELSEMPEYKAAMALYRRGIEAKRRAAKSRSEDKRMSLAEKVEQMYAEERKKERESAMELLSRKRYVVDLEEEGGKKENSSSGESNS